MVVNVQVRSVSNINEFNALRDDWNRLYRVDLNATVHRSWAWIKAWISTTDLQWQILCAVESETGELVGVFSIAIERHDDGRFSIYPGGHPLAAHTGFLCDPEYTRGTLRAWRKYLTQNVEWDDLHLKDVMDTRVDQFIADFSPFKFIVKRAKSTTCPSIKLPTTWEQYFTGCVGTETRKTYKKRFARVSRDAQISVACATQDSLNESLDALLNMWQVRWGRKSDQFVCAVKAILSTCFEHGSLYLRVMQANGVPIAAVAVYTDSEHKTAQCYMSGYDDQYARYSPGNILIFDSIEAAIGQGITEYDFGRGAQDYKYSVFGATDKYNLNVTISRAGVASSLKHALRKVAKKIVS